MAHLGVLRALEESGIAVDFIGGTSIGALVGAIYAADPNYFNVFSKIRKFAKVPAHFKAIC